MSDPNQSNNQNKDTSFNQGTPGQGYSPNQGVEKNPAEGMNIAGMVLGISGLVLTLFLVQPWFGLPVAIAGLIMSIIGIKKSKMAGYPANGMAIAGVICSSAAIGLSLICVSIVCFAITAFTSIIGGLGCFPWWW